MKNKKQKICQIDFSLVLPCYNEGEKIISNILYIKNYFDRNMTGFNYELIIVNDGSLDNTKEILKKLPTCSNIKYYSYDVNMGKGYAIKYGVSKCSGKIIGFMDSDLDIHPKFAYTYFKYLIDNKDIDIAIGSKCVGDKNHKKSLKRKLISKISMKINSVLFDLPIKDTQVGLKVFRKNAKDIISNYSYTYSYAFDVEFLFFANLNGLKIKELPIELSINDKNSSIRLYSYFKILYDLIILHKKINYIFAIKKQKVKSKTRIKLILLKCIIFPGENMLRFILKISRTKVNKV